jgi:hypothetical protein
VADAGFEGYKSIIIVELILKIAVAENAAALPLESFIFENDAPKNWRTRGIAMCHSTAVPYNAVDTTNMAFSK